MAESTFDLNTMLDMLQTGAMATRREPIPDGEYRSIIKSIDGAQSEKGTRLIVTHSIQDRPDLVTSLGLQEILVNQTVFLDSDGHGGLSLDSNKNIGLGQLREALGQNDPSQAWGMRMLVGAGPLLIKVSTRPDVDDPRQIYNDVKRVTRIR